MAMLRIPRLGFLGVGWIGRMRMEALLQSSIAEVVAFADAGAEACAAAAKMVPHAQQCSSLDQLLERDLDGLVIATPSALHADQAIKALRHGVPVFCQKPLGRNRAENEAVITVAREHDLLLGVDLSYRFIQGMTTLREQVQSGRYGQVFAVHLVFHNAYGPDKAWFYDPALSGGGCVIDLGIHLVDLALWVLDFPLVTSVESRLYTQGLPLADPSTQVEDYATALITLAAGTTLQLTCSWHAHAGCDAVIEAAFYGTQGGGALRNIHGSFYDFKVEQYTQTATELLSSPSADWGGRALINWVHQLAHTPAFDPSIERLIEVATVLDAMYEHV